jgi:hypothetical protein
MVANLTMSAVAIALGILAAASFIGQPVFGNLNVSPAGVV